MQVTVYGLRRVYAGRQPELSRAIHAAATEALGLPQDKRFHRFILLDDADFLIPDDRSGGYLIVELSLFAGRSVDALKALVRSLQARLHNECSVTPQDLEITIFETPRHNWGIRGYNGDELQLSYQVTV